ncbi:MAG: Aspartate 1-decarboxylase, partial [uncultured Acidimicrobiales bacterium]
APPDDEIEDPPDDGDRRQRRLRGVDHARPRSHGAGRHPRVGAGGRGRRRQRRPLRDLRDPRPARRGRVLLERGRRPPGAPRRQGHSHHLRGLRRRRPRRLPPGHRPRRPHQPTDDRDRGGPPSRPRHLSPTQNPSPL